ncbi:hypothetical protein GQR58_008945 [Nymphon striatum]|nr:hypothetical protein GQR58_008945 [Nymphon striatum]
MNDPPAIHALNNCPLWKSDRSFMAVSTDSDGSASEVHKCLICGAVSIFMCTGIEPFLRQVSVPAHSTDSVHKKLFFINPPNHFCPTLCPSKVSPSYEYLKVGNWIPGSLMNGLVLVLFFPTEREFVLEYHTYSVFSTVIFFTYIRVCKVRETPGKNVQLLETPGKSVNHDDNESMMLP